MYSHRCRPHNLFILLCISYLFRAAYDPDRPPTPATQTQAIPVPEIIKERKVCQRASLELLNVLFFCIQDVWLCFVKMEDFQIYIFPTSNLERGTFTSTLVARRTLCGLLVIILFGPEEKRLWSSLPEETRIFLHCRNKSFETSF